MVCATEPFGATTIEILAPMSAIARESNEVLTGNRCQVLKIELAVVIGEHLRTSIFKDVDGPTLEIKAFAPLDEPKGC